MGVVCYDSASSTSQFLLFLGKGERFPASEPNLKKQRRAEYFLLATNHRPAMKLNSDGRNLHDVYIVVSRTPREVTIYNVFFGSNDS